jgi:hypothetical protein
MLLPQDEMRHGLSYFQATIMEVVPVFYRCGGRAGGGGEVCVAREGGRKVGIGGRVGGPVFYSDA